MVAATSMRAPTATPTSRGAPRRVPSPGRVRSRLPRRRVERSPPRRRAPPPLLPDAPRRASPGWRPPGRRAARPGGPERRGSARAAAATPNGPNGSSADAVNNGLACFESRQYEDAVANFTAALNDFGVPSEDEPRGVVQSRVRVV